MLNTFSHVVEAGNTDTKLVATLLNAEYTLFAVNAFRDLTLNPFLSHWTDSIVAWEKSLGQISSKNGRGKSSQARVDQLRHALMCRLELLKRLLMEPFPPVSLSEASPRRFMDSVSSIELYENFDARLWLQVGIGADTLIWKNEDAMSTFRSSIAALVPQDTKLEQPIDVNNLHDRSTDQVFKMLQQNPSAVRSALLQMPADNIKALELFNGLLAMDIMGALAQAGTDRPQLIRDFLQHALRNLESLSEAIQGTARPRSASDDADHTPESSTPQPVTDAPSEIPTTELRERLVRAARLMALFVRNLIGKEYVTNTDINVEIMELVTRYSWVKEVKELPFT